VFEFKFSEWNPRDKGSGAFENTKVEYSDSYNTRLRASYHRAFRPLRVTQYFERYLDFFKVHSQPDFAPSKADIGALVNLFRIQRINLMAKEARESYSPRVNKAIATAIVVLSGATA
tara:strand:+ start:502 stop:852 length:351 start_codon:yes stop_codon:yes gene_type:complete